MNEKNNKPNNQKNVITNSSAKRATSSKPSQTKSTTNTQEQKKSNNKKTNRKKAHKKAKRKLIMKRTCLGFFITTILLFSIFAGVGIGVIARMLESTPDLEMISVEPTQYTTIFKDSTGKEVERYHKSENREYVQLDEIPKTVQEAIVSVEDERFYNHFGIDLKGILRATYVTIKNKITGDTGLEGASTITQQLIKNNVTKITRNSLKTKIQEQYLAVKYEKLLEKKLGSKQKAKDYILELYLNTIALGHGYNGVQAAALGYFNKDTSELTLAESASIAAITNNPSLYSPRSNPEGNKNRQKRILKKMLEQGMITQLEYSKAIEEDIYSKIPKTSGGKKEVEGTIIHSYFADSAFDQISKDLQEKYNISSQQANNLLYTGGLEVNLTLNPYAQKIVDDTFFNTELFPNVTYKFDVTYNVSIIDNSTEKQEHFEFKQFVKTREDGDTFVANKKAELQKKLSPNEEILAERVNFSSQPQGSMVVMDYKKGYVIALSAGRDEKLVNRGFNRATNSVRQPGSVFKVLAAFAPGIDTGILTPATIIDDVPFTKGTYSPSNWYSGYRGLSTVREGIRDSMNIVAVKALDMVGVETAYQYLLNFGFTTLEDDSHLATALGGLTNGVTQLEVTAAYGSIANGGKYLQPKFYTTVLDRNGNILLDSREREPVQVLKETSAFLLTNMMEDVLSSTGAKAKFKNLKMPIAGKTGTTQESKDLTFVGYTPYYVAGIWTGYDRYDKTVRNMQNLNQSYHLVLWREVMEKIHNGYKYKDFTMPEGIVKAVICQESGQLATDLCAKDPRGSRVRTEYFAKGTAPTESCSVHVSGKICTESNLLANEFCPKDLVQERVGIIRPIPYAGSASVADSIYEVNLPSNICNIHSEVSTEIESLTSNTEETQFSDNIFGFETTTEEIFENPIIESTKETTTLPEIFGKPIPSVPEITETTTQNIETTTQSITESTTSGEPVFE